MVMSIQLFMTAISSAYVGSRQEAAVTTADFFPHPQARLRFPLAVGGPELGHQLRSHGRPRFRRWRPVCILLPPPRQGGGPAERARRRRRAPDRQGQGAGRRLGPHRTEAKGAEGTRTHTCNNHISTRDRACVRVSCKVGYRFLLLPIFVSSRRAKSEEVSYIGITAARLEEGLCRARAAKSRPARQPAAVRRTISSDPSQ